MKKPLLISVLFGCLVPVSAQFTTIPIGVNDGSGGDTFVHDGPTQQDVNYSTTPALNFYAWTNSGVPRIKRSFLQFDLSAIPEGAMVHAARLSLFYNPDDVFEGIDVHAGDNAWVIQRTVGAWDPTAVTWNSQPAVTTQDAVYMSATSSGTEDFLDIDVTALVQGMIATGESGFRLSMVTEEVARMIIISSGEDVVATRHPKLEVDVEVGIGVAELPDRQDVSIVLQADASLLVSGPDRMEVTVFDARGQVLHTSRTRNTVVIVPTKGWAPAQYLVRVTDADGRSSVHRVPLVGY
ncbi:MAG: DNRLRE domain-containing protein [Flavobacteriales bacterium]